MLDISIPNPTREQLARFNQRFSTYIDTHYCGLTIKSARRYFLQEFIWLNRAAQVLPDYDTFRVYKLRHLTESLDSDPEPILLYLTVLFDKAERLYGFDFYQFDIRSAWNLVKGWVNLPLVGSYPYETFKGHDRLVRELISR